MRGSKKKGFEGGFWEGCGLRGPGDRPRLGSAALLSLGGRLSRSGRRQGAKRRILYAEVSQYFVCSVLQASAGLVQLACGLGGQLAELVTIADVGQCPKNKIRAHKNQIPPVYFNGPTDCEAKCVKTSEHILRRSRRPFWSQILIGQRQKSCTSGNVNRSLRGSGWVFEARTGLDAPFMVPSAKHASSKTGSQRRNWHESPDPEAPPATSHE